MVTSSKTSAKKAPTQTAAQTKGKSAKNPAKNLAKNPAKNPAKNKVESARKKVSQEGSWSGVLKLVDRFAQTRPDDQLASLLVEMRELNISRVNPNRFYQGKPAIRDFAANYYAKFGMAQDGNFHFPSVNDRKYTTRTKSPARYLMGAVRPETEAIIELGSGWSFNLFQLFVGLGRTRCKEVDFIGAEYTKAGRTCARRIADFDGAIRYSDQHMDYRKPNISFLKDYKKHILVFTHHSIEQVDRIDRRLYQQLSELDADVTLIHFEPVGWQRDRAVLAARRRDDKAFFKALTDGLPNALHTEQDQINNAAWWSWRGRYNINLTSIVNHYVETGMVEMVQKAYDFSVAGNVLNPTTMYHLDFLKSRDTPN